MIKRIIVLGLTLCALAGIALGIFALNRTSKNGGGPVMGFLHSSSVVLTDLRCEYLSDPLGIDAVNPRLSWKIEAKSGKTVNRGQKQTAYQMLVASTPAKLDKGEGDQWNSGTSFSQNILNRKS